MRRHGVGILEGILDRGSLMVEDRYLDEVELRRAATRFPVSGERVYDVYRPVILESGLASLKEPHHAHA